MPGRARALCWFGVPPKHLFFALGPAVGGHQSDEKFEIASTRSPARETRVLPGNRANRYVYLSTSSMVVSPAKMLRKPSWRSVIIPSSTAFCLIVTVGARSLINSRTGSVILRS